MLASAYFLLYYQFSLAIADDQDVMFGTKSILSSGWFFASNLTFFKLGSQKIRLFVSRIEITTLFVQRDDISFNMEACIHY